MRIFYCVPFLSRLAYAVALILSRPLTAKVGALKTASAEFAAMPRLAMRFRGILRSKDVEKFGLWLADAQQSGI